MKSAHTAAAAFVGAAAFFAAGASAAPLDVKLGLWEVTLTTQMSGELPIEAGRLSPQQRAQLQAMLQAQSGRTHTYKTCLTKKQLEEDPAAEPPEEGETCTTKIVSQTSKHWKGTRVCTGNGRRREFDIDMRAVSRERGQGTVRVVFSGGGQTMTGNNKMSSRWLSSNCGSEK
ncbi:MAG: DUF3617 domain-containing protein [Burkholderiales bacterium]